MLKNGRSRQLLLSIIRHGETSANVAGILQGQSLDPSFKLTELGISQAQAAGVSLQGRSWWKVICSDLPRTRETAFHIFNGIDDNNTYEKIEYKSIIREASFGLCEGKHKDSRNIENQLIEEYMKENGEVSVIPKSETLEHVYMRCRELMNYLLSSANEQGEGDVVDNGVKHVLIISHGGYIKKFLKSVCELDDTHVINNTSITTIAIDIEIDSDSVEGGDAVIKCITPMSVNNTGHLEHGLMSTSTE